MECELLQSPMISYRSLLYNTTVLYDICIMVRGRIKGFCHGMYNYNAKQKHLGCKKKCEAKKNQQLKALISNKAKKSVN